MTPEERVARLLASPRITSRAAPRDAAWPILAGPEPADLAALYAACDGLAAEDGLRILGRGELFDATRWLILDKSLDWPDDLVIVGERTDLVVVLDLDVERARAGGGVLEAATDNLGALARVASDVVAYAALHAGGGDDPVPPPEVAARAAASRGDAAALAAALARPFYPGADAVLAQLSLELGSLRLRARDAAGALEAFEQSVEARARGVRRGAESAERRVAWRAAAHAARQGGDERLAETCEKRSLEANL